jgi:hypothetical protein
MELVYGLGAEVAPADRPLVVLLLQHDHGRAVWAATSLTATLWRVEVLIAIADSYSLANSIGLEGERSH